MTVTIKRSTAALLIGLMGVLGGLGIGQVSDALSASSSASGPATASYVAGWEKDMSKMVYILTKINTKLGSSVSADTIMGELEKIKSNTYGSCDKAGSFYCHN